MSKGLFDARRKLSSVASMLKQDKVAAAAQTMYNGLQDMMRESLLRSEKEEFANIITNVVRELNYNKTVQKQFSIKIDYTPGQEAALLETIRLLMETLDAMALEEASQALREREETKKAQLAQAQKELESGQQTAAKNIFEALGLEHPDDVGLLVEISESYERAGLLDEALHYMERARELDPRAAYILNKLGILHRRKKNFPESEKMFSEAEALTPDDPYIHFNKGRLYIDWEKWKQATEAGRNALALQPDFLEARKLAEYAAKRI